MNCFNHPELVSVAVCQDCQKGLCSECSGAYSIPICNTCNLGRIKTEKKAIYKEFFITITIAIAGAFLFIKEYESNGGSVQKLFLGLKKTEFFKDFKWLDSLGNLESILVWVILIYFFASIYAG